MQCSISPKNANSSWLDRLRTSKGFPISSDLENLDEFLSSNPNTNRNPNPNPIPKPSPKPPTNKDPNFFNLMTNVLSDLFIMGNPANPHTQKASRKQANPRICNGVVGNREVSPSSVNNGVAEVKKRKMKVKKKRESEGVKDSELVGFSRTEVTVIDTSLSPDWKASRVLYRKGLVWKVREKKMVRIGRKRRRKSSGSEKEKKVVELEREGSALLNKGCTQTDKREDSKESGSQTLISRRPKFSRSPCGPVAKNSNVLRLSIISKKNVATGSKNVLKGK